MTKNLTREYRNNTQKDIRVEVGSAKAVIVCYYCNTRCNTSFPLIHNKKTKYLCRDCNEDRNDQ